MASVPTAGGDVDEQAQVDAVAGRERQPLEHRAPTGVLARQRLDDAAEVGEQEREQRPGHELGDPSAADAVASRGARRSP